MATLNPATVTLISTEDFEKKFFPQMLEKLVEVAEKKKVERPLTIKEAAAYFRISYGTLLNHLNNHEIPSSIVHVIGGQKRFFISELEAFLKRS